MNRNTKFERIEKKSVISNIALKSVAYLMLTVWALLVLFPFYWMILTSVKSYGSYNSEFIPKLFTLSPTTENYITAFTGVNLGKYLINTTVFTLITTALMLVIIIPAAFAFARSM